MNNEDLKIDFWGDGMRIFLAYIDRQFKKNSDYNPHPIIRALELAFSKIEEVPVGERVMGVSQDGTKDAVYNPYLIILKKHGDQSIEVEKILNVQLDKELPLDVMIITFRLQIQLDSISGGTVTVDQAVDALNAVIPGNNFYALGDRWKEARDLFVEALKAGKIALPRSPEMEKMAEDLLKIRENTPWEEYPNGVRALIGSQITSKLGDNGPSVVITTPKSWPVEKYKIFDIATEFLLGKSSEYMNSLEKLRKNRS